MAEKSIFQKAYNYFDDIHTPDWLEDLLLNVQEIVIGVVLKLGEITLEQIKAKIVEVGQLDIPSSEKFKKVFEYIKIELKISDLKDSLIRMLIEILVARLKGEKVIP